MKISGDVGVERVFPINMPALQKIEVDKRGKVRRSRIFYFRDLRGKRAKNQRRCLQKVITSLEKRIKAFQKFLECFFILWSLRIFNFYSPYH